MEGIELRELTEEEVRAFLRENTKGDACLSCGEQEWNLDAGSHGLFRTHIWGQPVKGRAVADGIGKGVPQFTLTCSHCGFVRIHDLYVAMAWLETRAEVNK